MSRKEGLGCLAQTHEWISIIPTTTLLASHEKELSKKNEIVPSSGTLKFPLWSVIRSPLYTSCSCVCPLALNRTTLLMFPLSSVQCHSTTLPAFTSMGIVKNFETGICIARLAHSYLEILLVRQAAQAAFLTMADSSQIRLHTSIDQPAIQPGRFWTGMYL